MLLLNLAGAAMNLSTAFVTPSVHLQHPSVVVSPYSSSTNSNTNSVIIRNRNHASLVLSEHSTAWDLNLDGSSIPIDYKKSKLNSLLLACLSSICRQVCQRVNDMRSNDYPNRVSQKVRSKLSMPFNQYNVRRKFRSFAGAMATVGLLLAGSAKSAFAMGVPSSGGVIKTMDRRELLASFSTFLVLFTILALLHAVEIAITTLYPWKVRDFAEEERDSNKKGKGTFTILNEDIQRVLITILVTGTTCSIYATTIFSDFMGAAFGVRGEKYVPIVLTSLTLFFVELLPKSVGVYAAEKVARVIVPPVNLLANIVSPVGLTLSYLSKNFLKLCGMKVNDDSNAVSDSELRLIVTGARDSGTIDHSEQEMIQGVLNLQTTRIRELMKPRVEVVACDESWNVAQVLHLVQTSGYSRIPVYKDEIDNIVGIVLAKSVLDYFVNGVVSIKSRREIEDGDTSQSNERLESVSIDGNKDAYVKAYTGTELASRMNMNIKDAGLIESCYFVPDTAFSWSVLQEMRKRRVHVAIVVDEYGGTEGLVSLEDIVEEVVGEIYDEDDADDFYFSEDSIQTQEDGSFLVRGDADLEDCDTILNLDLGDEILKDFSTVSGYLCSLAGEIPKEGDFVMASSGDGSNMGWCFECLETDEKRIRQVRVSRLLGVSLAPKTDADQGKKDSSNSEKSMDIDHADELDEFSEQQLYAHFEPENESSFYPTESNFEPDDINDETSRIERIVQSNEFKRELVDNINAAVEEKLVE